MDISGRIFFSLHYNWVDFKSLFYTAYVKLLCLLKGINIGHKCRFYGYSLLFRHPESKIHIADNCRFRSSLDSNMIGVSRPCVISTHAVNAIITIGDGCGFSATSIMCLKSISIGKDVIVGANSVITDSDWHNVDPSKRKLFVTSGKPVMIGDNVFIGYGATILKGVTIGENAVIGANSVVTTDIPANSIAAGNPCKVVSQIRS